MALAHYYYWFRGLGDGDVPVTPVNPLGIPYVVSWDQVTPTERPIYLGYRERDYGQSVQLHGLFKDQADDSAIDPSLVQLVVRDPSGTETTYEYGIDDELLRIADGHYRLMLMPDVAGLWFYRWLSDKAARERRMMVRQARAIA